MTITFLHMGCDQETARAVLQEIAGVSEVDQQYAGLKLEAGDLAAKRAYFSAYYAAVRLSRERSPIGPSVQKSQD